MEMLDGNKLDREHDLAWSGQVLTAFHYFNKLPPELRSIVWECVAYFPQPDIYAEAITHWSTSDAANRNDPLSDTFFDARRRAPVVIHVCMESRQVEWRVYIPCNTTKRGGISSFVFINPIVDRINIVFSDDDDEDFGDLDSEEFIVRSTAFFYRITSSQGTPDTSDDIPGTTNNAAGFFQF
ncbi:hypothetical protein BP6252_13267 [Coleophoma cylindrospora]|uniref:2EXR domain-containing protein n=1 Tax=Coleophoma cylindrospora TaxID=1849047 RepID=A0A3D8QAJ1_9HELO|nr:hypothetical protein BP6252_13267 [Coleophoma cylindrospora]